MEESKAESVLSLRAKGLSYSAISAATGTPLGTVKSLCHRASEESCEWCGKPVKPVGGKRKKRFCCSACRAKWHRAHPGGSPNAVCAHCGAAFFTKGDAGRKYCSQECYKEARNANAR